MDYGTLWNLWLKAFAILAAAGLLSLALSKSSASKRHAVWLVAVLGVMLLPVFMLKLPRWEVSSEKIPAITPLARISDIYRPLVATPPRTRMADIMTTYLVRRASGRKAPKPFDYGRILVWLWAVTTFCVAGRFLVALIALARAKRQCVPWQNEQVDGLAGKLGIKRRITVLLSPALTVPATAGCLRPIVLLPEDAPKWTSERLEMVLSHELAHIRRNDWFWTQVVGIACVLYPVNPLVWVAAARMRAESEVASDDLVLSLGFGAKVYASELLDIAQLASRRMPAAVSMASNAKVEGRLRSIIDGKRSRKAVAGKAFGFALVGALAVAAAIAAFTPLLARITHRSVLNRTPPQIPVVSTQSLGNNVYLANNCIAALPNGIRIRLVGLSTEEDEDHIWEPDGSPLPDPRLWREGGLYASSGSFHPDQTVGGPLGKGGMARNFYWELESDSNTEASTVGYVADPSPVAEKDRLNPLYSGTDRRLNGTRLKAGTPICGAIRVPMVSKQNAGVYRFGAASGPWTTVADTPNPYINVPNTVALPNQHGLSRFMIFVDEHPNVQYRSGQDQWAQSFLFGSNAKIWNPGVAHQLVLLDSEGKKLDPGEPIYDVDGYPMYHPDDDTFRKATRIVLQECPYQWAEFRDIQLRPNFEAEELQRLATLTPQLHGTATGVAPGFSKKLSNGTTVSISSVSRAVLDQEDWRFDGQPGWRADGQVLAPLSLNDATAHRARAPRGFNVRADGTSPLVSFEVSVTGQNKDATVKIVPLDMPEMLNESIRVSWSRMGLSDYDHSFVHAVDPNAKTANLRVGVANGGWTTIAERDIDLPELPAIKKGDDRMITEGVGTGLTVTIGPLNEEAPSAVIEFLPDVPYNPITLAASLRDVAIQCVAVLKNGNDVVLDVGAEGMGETFSYHIPARHGEWGEGYNHILASDIAKIQIQTRPYEWAEFAGIALKPRHSD